MTETVREHDLLSIDCWCHPVRVYKAKNGNEVWVHQYEDDPQGPPPEAIAEAIVNACFDDEFDEEEEEDEP